VGEFWLGLGVGDDLWEGSEELGVLMGGVVNLGMGTRNHGAEQWCLEHSLASTL